MTEYAARSYITLHRKAKDGEQGPQGPSGKDAVLFTINPSVINVACDSKGEVKTKTYTCSYTIYKGNTNITSTVLPAVSKSSGCTASVGSGVVKIGSFNADSGYATFTATVEKVDYTATVNFQKVLDGAQGENAATFNISQSSLLVACDNTGALKQTSFTLSYQVFKGTTDVTLSSVVSCIENVGCIAETPNADGTLIIKSFTEDSGYAIFSVPVGSVTCKAKVTYSKIYDGNTGPQGPQGPSGHSYYIQCAPITIYLNAAGNMKSSSQTTQASLWKDGAKITSGVKWSYTTISDSFPETATFSISTTGLITIKSYNTVAQSTATIKAVYSDIAITYMLPIGSVKDGVAGTAGLKGDIMLYKGQWQSNVVYKKHYELSAGSGEYYTDYVSYGTNTDKTMLQYWAALQNSQGNTPMGGSDYWKQFATTEFLATRLVISDQINSNIIDAVELNAEKFYANTLKAKTIDAENATFNNLTVSGYFRSGFEAVNYETLNTKITGTTNATKFLYNGTYKDLYGYRVTDKLNIMIIKPSNNPIGMNGGYIILPNDIKYEGARVLIYAAPYYKDEGTGSYTEEDNMYVNIVTGIQKADSETPYNWNQNVGWFLNTKVSAGTTGNYLGATQIKLWGGYIELLGVPFTYTEASTQEQVTYCRWLVLNVQALKDVEYFRYFPTQL